jgi:hypothetical protein
MKPALERDDFGIGIDLVHVPSAAESNSTLCDQYLERVFTRQREKFRGSSGRTLVLPLGCPTTDFRNGHWPDNFFKLPARC